MLTSFCTRIWHILAAYKFRRGVGHTLVWVRGLVGWVRHWMEFLNTQTHRRHTHTHTHPDTKFWTFEHFELFKTQTHHKHQHTHTQTQTQTPGLNYWTFQHTDPSLASGHGPPAHSEHWIECNTTSTNMTSHRPCSLRGFLDRDNIEVLAFDEGAFEHVIQLHFDGIYCANEWKI